MRTALDRLYAMTFVLAALCLIAIAILVLIQIGGRLVDRTLIAAGGTAKGIAVPSLAEIGGFLFVAAAFLGLPGTLRSGGHVRVTMLTKVVPISAARVITLLILSTALALALFATWHSAVQVLDSISFNSVSFGMIPIPLWIPQSAMTLGLATFAISLGDELMTTFTGGTPAFLVAEAAQGIEDGGH